MACKLPIEIGWVAHQESNEPRGYPMPTKRRLKTVEDVRRYLAHVLCRVEAQELDAQVAGRMAYISNVLLKAIADGVLERRVSELERALKKD